MKPSNSPPQSTRPVLILGGGIHGAAVARELALNGVPVVLVEANDLAAGATSKSSRLIHGGLRYLEYGDIRLVRESLIERRRLLDLAPHLVRPLRLFVPTTHRWSGLLRSILGFFKLARTRLGRWLLSRSERRAPRGYWPVRIGLWMYDLFSWGDGLPKSRGTRDESRVPDGASPPVASIGSRFSTLVSLPAVDPQRYRWMSEYSDAQMLYPERCVFALLADAKRAAHERGVVFRVVPHARLVWRGLAVQIVPSAELGARSAEREKGIDDADDRSAIRAPSSALLDPALIVNVSGAWGDLTLRGIDAGTTPLFAGTKGSHFVTRHPALRAALGDGGVYAETADRRLCFVLPFGDAVLVGTTDERWSGPPDEAVASDAELDYLLSLVETVFGLTLSRLDIAAHYSGVRPLPRTTDTSNAAVSRDHSLAEHRLHGIPIVTLVGGKLTTFRSVGEQIADRVFKQLGLTRQTSTRDRMLVGGDGFPREPSEWPKLWQQWAADYGTTVEEASVLWPLYGMRTQDILAAVTSQPPTVVADTPFTTRVARWVIEHEWVTTLDDLIERRLMLVFAPGLSLATLHDLAECLVASGRMSADAVPPAIESTRERLRIHYGRDMGSSRV
ncbi:MAG: glycerol-3-phosphate dehydrogenase/oxidase [Planctomycetota bacterium]